MDAVDGNLAMLEKLKDKDIYNNTYHAILGDKNMKICEELQDGSYDVAVIVGGFGQSHLPVNSLYQVSKLDLAKTQKEFSFLRIFKQNEFTFHNCRSKTTWTRSGGYVVKNASFCPRLG